MKSAGCGGSSLWRKCIRPRRRKSFLHFLSLAHTTHYYRPGLASPVVAQTSLHA